MSRPVLADQLPGKILSNFIDGKFSSDGEPFDNINPKTGARISQAVEADADAVDRAVSAATAALDREWGATSPVQRARYLNLIADGIERRFDEFVAAEVADTGKDESHARTIDIPRSIANFRTYAELIGSSTNDSIHETAADGSVTLNYSIRRPQGVVAAIAPWNLPLLLLTWKVAPALACGNSVIAKPSELTPSTATLLAEVIHNIGLPAGAFNLLHGFGRGSAGELLAGHRGVDAISFTGSSATGAAIMRLAADTVKPISFELGGKNAAIIFGDCDFDQAVNGSVRSSFSNCGQVCLSTERIYVERPIYERFVSALKERAESIVLGGGQTAVENMGPLISEAHRRKVLGYFDLAVQEGARVVTGNEIPCFGDERDEGFYVRPTIWTGLQEDARCLHEEIFGPVCHIAPFDDEAEAVRLANNTQYGLAATIWTQNLARAHRVAARMNTGIVWVNSWFLRHLHTPFGGMKLSGIGREGGWHSMEFYSQPINICIKS
ncbi:MAG: 2-hydroxymuconic semialdehyde dehydrogenase [Parvularcula sp.]|nr:2-hydroxymuconic semialdehyde dehydrogenase [Parvularcula sp.]